MCLYSFVSNTFEKPWTLYLLNLSPKLLPPDRLAAARSMFPHIGAGKIYLNHAATSPLSIHVVEAMSRHIVDRSSGTIDNYPVELQNSNECRTLIQRLINAESPDRIALATNTSDAINIVTSGIPWKTGDRVLLNDIEFPANVYPYLPLKRYGVELDILQSRDGKTTVEMIENGLTPRTRVVALSAVQFLSGYRADLAAIGAMCRKRGILFVVDGIQAVGAVPIDVQAMKIDAMSAGAQKWQMSPHGSGFLYITEALQTALQQKYIGWLSVADPWQFSKFDQPLATSAKRYEGGTLNFPSIIGMKAALETLLGVGIAKIESHVLALTARLREGLQAGGPFASITPEIDSERAGIIAFAATDGRDLTPVLAGLQQRRIDASLREGKLRFSPHFYNSPTEIDMAIGAVRELLS
jgi:cysteine desulfurase/selenocysteine lyase